MRKVCKHLMLQMFLRFFFPPHFFLVLPPDFMLLDRVLMLAAQTICIHNALLGCTLAASLFSTTLI